MTNDLDRAPTGGAESGTALARHGQLARPAAWRSVAGLIAGALAVLLVAGASISAIVVHQLGSDIDTFVLPGQTAGEQAPSIAAYEGGFNILIVGSDVCEDDSGCNGRGSAELNDVTMLLHVSEDQTNATAVSFPRDLVVPIPECPKADGSGSYSAMSARPINETLSYGGLSCTVLTVQELTGLDIQFAGLIKFSGVIAMSDAVGGVPVCVSGPVVDAYSGINLPEAGTYTLSGSEALSFLRTRHGVGDGGDLTRISSQQVYLSSLLRTLKSADTLGDPVKVYNLARAATSSMTLSESFAQLDTLAAVALALKDVPLESFNFVQYPGSTEGTGVFAGKVQPVEAKATELFDKIRADEPFTLATGGDGQGSVASPDAPAATGTPVEPEASAAPSASAEAPVEELDQRGQSAADVTCSLAN
jgi:LCP family protein required for cell wall assembly